MRRLVLVAVLGLALPAFAAEEHAPKVQAPTPDEVVSTAEPTSEEVDPELAEVAPERPPVPAEAVARGTFATAVDQREPVDSITSLESDQSRVYYFTEFVGINGRRVTHRCEYQGEVVAEVPIEIGAPRWRAYSSKNLLASHLGEWTVSVVDESGHVVHTNSFVYEEAAPAPDIAAPVATPGATAVSPAAPAASSTAPAPGEAPEAERARPAPAQP